MPPDLAAPAAICTQAGPIMPKKTTRPFSGELMICSLCGRRRYSDPHIESGWTRVEMDEFIFYVCDHHISSQTKDFKAAWQSILYRLMNIAADRRQAH